MPNRRGPRLYPLLWLSSMVLATTCGGSATDAGSDGPPTIIPVTVSVTPNLIFARQGLSVLATVTVTRTTGTSGPVTLTATGLSTGVTATFSPASITAATGTSQLTITAEATAPPATDTLIITAKGIESAGHLEIGTIGVGVLVSLPQVVVSRSGTGSGTVTSSPAGINCGSTCSAGFSAGTSVTLTAAPAQGSTFAGWSGGCSGATTTCSVTSGQTTPVIATFNSSAASFSMAVAPTMVTVPQGTTGAVTVTLTRTNGFAGAVNLAVASPAPPPGLTLTPNPPSITGTTSTLNITASSSLPAGNYPITLATSGTGVALQTANIAVQVTPTQGGTPNVSMSFARCDPIAVPTWFAVQNGNGAWTRVTASNSAFIFTPGATGGVAYVVPDGPGFRTQVLYGTAAEITAIATGPGPCMLNAQIGTKQVKGVVTHAAVTSTVMAAIGGADATLVQFNAGFTLGNVAAGRRDAVVTQTVTNTNGSSTLQKMVLRRNVQYGNGSTAPDFDIIGAESFSPSPRRFLFTNLAGDQSSGSMDFVTANGALSTYFESIGVFFTGVASDGVLLYAIPDTLLQSGDFQLATVIAAAADGKSGRLVESMTHSVTDQTITFGPPLATPTVTTLGTTPYLRLRAQLSSQSAYDGGISLDYDQEANTVSVLATAGYFGGLPSKWTVDVPDLSGAGFDASWGLHSGSLSWVVTAVHGDFLPFLGATMVDGAQIVGGLATSDAASFSAARERRRSPRF